MPNRKELGALLTTQVREDRFLFLSAPRADPLTYGIDIREQWEVKPEPSAPGRVVLTVGWLARSA